MGGGIRFLAGVLAILAVPTAASAISILDFQNPGVLIYQQTQNSPCVIGDPSCDNGTFPYTSQSGPAGPPDHVYDLLSPAYTVSEIRTLVGDTFFIGIDVNWGTGQDPEVLELFELSINGVVQFQFAPAVGEAFAAQNNGNGYSDALLLGFDLTPFADSATAQFHAVWSNDSDGMEEYFLVRTGAPPIPEPASLLLVGTGLVGLGAVARRRLNRRR